MLKQIPRNIGRLLGTFIAFIALYLSAAFVLSRIPVAAEPDGGNDVTAYIPFQRRPHGHRGPRADGTDGLEQARARPEHKGPAGRLRVDPPIPQLVGIAMWNPMW